MDLISLAKKQTYLTYEQVNQYLPNEATNPDKLDNLLAALDAEGIELVDTPPQQESGNLTVANQEVSEEDLVEDDKSAFVDEAPKLSDDPLRMYLAQMSRIGLLTRDQEIALADLQEGSNFGELSAVDCRGRSARVVGSDTCVVARMERDVFLEMLLRYPKVSLNLLDQLANIIRNLTERVSVLSTLSPHQRVYHELLRISEPDPRGDGTWVIDVVPAHNQIAGWAGTDKMKVANAIGGLVRNGIIKRHHRSFVIIDHPRLKFLAGLD